MKLTQSQLIRAVSKKLNYRQRDVKAIIEAVKQEIIDSEEVFFRGFAIFRYVKQSPLTVTIPSGKIMTIPEKRKLIAKFSKTTKSAI